MQRTRANSPTMQQAASSRRAGSLTTVERRLAALENETQEQGASMRMLMELLADTMPIAQCHELLADVEHRCAAAAATDAASPPAAAASTDGTAAALDALRGDVDALRRSQQQMEQRVGEASLEVGIRLAKLEEAGRAMPDAATLDAKLAEALAEHSTQLEQSVGVTRRAEITASEERVQDTLADELGSELAEAVEEMAGVAEAAREAAEAGVAALAARLDEAAAESDAILAANNAKLAKLLEGGASRSKAIESLTSEMEQSQAQMLSTLMEVRAVEASQTGFKTRETEREQGAEEAFETLTGDVEEYVTKTMQAHEERLEMHISHSSSQNERLTARATAVEERCVIQEAASTTLLENTAVLDSSAVAAVQATGQQLATAVKELEERIDNARLEFAAELDATVAGVSAAVDEQTAATRVDLASFQSQWKRSEQDATDRLERVVRALEQAATEQGAEQARQLSAAELRLSHKLVLQTDAHEQVCAALNRELFNTTALLRREQNEGLAKQQLEVQSNVRDVAAVRRALEQAQQGVASSIEELNLQSSAEQLESQRQIEARIKQLSAECGDLVGSARRSCDRQVEHTREQLLSQQTDSAAKEAAERTRLATQVQQLQTVVKRSAQEEIEARAALARSMAQQFAESATAGTNTATTLGEKIEKIQTGVEQGLARASSEQQSAVESVRRSLTRQIETTHSELGAALRESEGDWAMHQSQLENQSSGGIDQLRTEMMAQRAESLGVLASQDEQLAARTRELGSLVDEQSSQIRSDMVSRSETAHASLKRAMAEVEVALSAKADTTLVETVDRLTREEILTISTAGCETATKLSLLQDVNAFFQKQISEEVKRGDKAMRSDFQRSSVQMRRDFGAADTLLTASLEGNLSELDVEIREGLGKQMGERLTELETTVVKRLAPLEGLKNVIGGCAMKSEVGTQLGVMKMELTEARSAVGELEGRAEKRGDEMSESLARLEAELAELAIEVSLIDVATAS